MIHISALQVSGIQSLREGQKVSFDTEPDKRQGTEGYELELETAETWKPAVLSGGHSAATEFGAIIW